MKIGQPKVSKNFGQRVFSKRRAMDQGINSSILTFSKKAFE
jgi:hypothetical protein